MAYSEGQLNGSADYKVGIDVWYSGVQDWGANTSRFDWNVRIVGTYGSWTNGTCSWSASIGGVGYSGTFTLPSGWGSPRIVGSGSTWHGHDGRGWRGGFASDAWMSVPHDRIGSGGSGQAWVDAPRIPKTPMPPSGIALDTPKPSSLRYVFSGNPDDGGRGILEWQAQYATRPDFADAVTIGSNGTSTLAGLKPSTRYYARSRGRNEIGWSGWSNVLDNKTLAALFFMDPSNPGAPPEPVTLYAWNGSGWEMVDLLIDPELDGSFVYPAA